MIKRLVTFALALTISLVSLSQQETYIWYFGNGVGLDFRTDPPTQLCDGNATLQQATGEGVTSVADASGNLLFYTNGVEIFDASHNVMSNGSGLSGDGSSTNSAIITPVPGSDTLYFVTTTGSGGTGDLEYSVVDISQNGGLGAVITKNTNLASGIFEGQVVIPHFNGSDYWLISQTTSSADINVYAMTSAGTITLSNTYALGLVNSGVGVMKANLCFTQMAISYWHDNEIYVFDFNNTTGAITGVSTTIANVGSAGEEKAYGVEFSPNGDLLYATNGGLNGQAEVYQFDLTAGNAKTTWADPAIGNVIRSGDVQLGPDGRIYISYYASTGESFIGRIENPDIAGTGANLDPDFMLFENAASGGCGLIGEGLPPLQLGYLADGLFITVADACENANTQFGFNFAGAVSTDPNSIKWNFGEVTTDTVYDETDPTHIYASTGTYTVYLTIKDICGRWVETTRDVTIATSRPQVNPLPSPRCINTDITITGSGPGAVNYNWYATQSSNTPLTANSATHTQQFASFPDTVWVQEIPPTYTLGASSTDMTGGSNLFTDDKRTYFTVLSDIYLTSVDVHTGSGGGANSCSGDNKIILYDASTDLAVPGFELDNNFGACGTEYTLTLNWQLPPGDYYLNSDNDKFYGIGQAGSYTQGGLLEIDGNIPNGGAETGSFYNFIFEEVFECNVRIAIPVTEACGCVNATPTLSLTTGSNPGCEGEDYTLTAASSETSPTFIWYKDGVLTSHTGTTYTFNNASDTVGGSYTVTVTTPGCTFESSPSTAVALVINPTPVLNISNPDSVCSPNTIDLTAAAVTATSTDIGVLTYWTNSGATTSLSSPDAVNIDGTYYIMATNNGCTDTAAVLARINATPSLTITDPDSVCSPNTIDLTAGAVTAGSSNTGTLTYWNDAGATSSLGSANAVGIDGTYYIMADNNGCTDTAAVLARINNTPSLTITDPDSVCTPNTIDLTAAAVTAGSSNIGTLTYWNDAGASSSLGSANAVSIDGTYFIMADNNGCSDTAAVLARINDSPSLTITDPDSVCLPATVNITVGAVTAGSTNIGTLSYWLDANASSTLVNSTAIASSGTYYIMANNNGCTDTAAVEVTVNQAPVLSITNPDSVCSPASIDITAAAVTTGSTNAGTLTYWNDAGATSSLGSANAISTDGTYYIMADNNGCTDTAAVIATINQTPTLSITDPDSVCSPATIDITAAAVTAGSTNTGTLTYWNDAGATSSLGSANAVSTDGTYYIMADNNGCTDTAAVLATINQTPALSITDPDSVCGPATVDITATAVTAGSTNIGTLTYWTDAGATSSLVNTTAISTTGTYYIMANNNGCTDTTSVYAHIDAAPPTASLGADQSVCTADPITLPGNNPSPGSGQWTIISETGGVSIDNNTLFNSGVSGLDNTAESLEAEWCISNGVCPSSCDTVLLTGVGISPPSITLTAAPTSVCEGDSIIFTGIGVNGGTKNLYSFYNASTDAFLDSNHIGNLTVYNASVDTSIYIVYYSNSSCLGANPDSAISSTESVTVNTQPVLSITNPDSVCSPNTIDITAAAVTSGSIGGGTLSYFTDGGLTSPEGSPSAINTDGTYYIFANNGGCSDTAAVEVIINQTPVLSITNPDSACTPESIDLTAAAVTTGSSNVSTLSYWNDISASSSLTSPDAVTLDGTYYIVGDNNGCADTASVEVIINVTPVLSITNPDSVCSPNTIDITTAAVTSGSSDATTLSYWSDAGASATLASANNISVDGTYYILADNNGCTDTAAVEAIINESPSFTITNPNDTCSPATIDATNAAYTLGSTIVGSISYFEDADATISYTNPNAITSSDTVYAVNTNNGCSDTAFIAINIISTPNFIITNPDSVCSPNTIDLTASAITLGSTDLGSISYFTDAALSTTETTPNTITTLGTYYLYSGSTQCSDTAEVQVTINTGPVLTITDPTVTCSPDTVDLTAASITSGSTNATTLTYFTDSLATSPIADASLITNDGRYFIVANNNGCTDTAGVTVSFDQDPTTANAGLSSSVCISDPIAFNGNTPSTGTGIWTLITENGGVSIDDVNANNSGISGLDVANDSIQASWCISNGTCPTSCDTVTLVGIGISPPTVALSAIPTSVCAGDSTVFTANGVNGGSLNQYEFYDNNDALLETNNTGAYTISNLTSDVSVYVIYRSNSSCLGSNPDSALSNVVAIAVDSIPSLTFGSISDTCAPATIDLSNALSYTGLETGTISYFDDALLTSSNSGTVSATGTYYAFADNNGCTDTTSISVTINAAPSLSTTDPASICEDQTVDLTASIDGGEQAGLTYVYYSDGSLSSSISNQTSYSDSGYAYIEVTDAIGCFSRDSILVVVVPIPTPTLDLGDTTLCENSNLTLPATASAGGTVSWFHETTSLSTGTSLTLSGLAATDNGYYYVSESNGSCTGYSDSLQVTVEAPPTLTYVSDYSITTGESITLSVTGATNYDWDPDATLSSTTISSPVASPAMATTYTFEAYNTDPDCFTNGTINVNVLVSVLVPNGFSPDNDGANDDFRVIGLEGRAATVRIYNRWGNLIYEVVNYTDDTAWDGTFNGNPSPPGTYFYTIELGDATGEEETLRSGYITLMR